jgi:hypothetical protein
MAKYYATEERNGKKTVHEVTSLGLFYVHDSTIFCGCDISGCYRCREMREPKPGEIHTGAELYMNTSFYGISFNKVIFNGTMYPSNGVVAGAFGSSWY